MPDQEKPTILVVDDEDVSRLMLEGQLGGWGFLPILAPDGESALKILEKTPVDLVISDQEMDGLSGIGLLEKSKKRFPGVPFIILTAHGSLPKAIISLKAGADDYLEKSCEPEELLATVRHCLKYSRLNIRSANLSRHLQSLYSFSNIVTRSPRMQKCLEMAERVTATPKVSVLIGGESGTGKEVLARAIHFSGESMDAPFVAINCAGIPSGLLESELFGHVRGAFTGAGQDREGKFKAAGKGTLLLDEIGDLPMELQGKLLRVIQTRTYEPVGSNTSIPVRCRIIAATNKDLEELVARGGFREDLFHRINVFPIHLPPLRERRKDIPLLVEHFLGRLREELGKPLEGISRESMDCLEGYSWPGNVRELKNCLERSAILADGPFIENRHLIICSKGDSQEDHAVEKAGMVRISAEIPARDFSLDAVIEQALEQALARFDGNKTKAAQWLGVDRKIFYRR